MNIVIIDDNQINVTLLKHMVKALPGAAAHCFLSSADGLAWCRDNDPDLIIVDYMMPPPDGLALIDAIRAMPDKAGVPMLMITASHENDVRYQALEKGANDFLTKPIDRIEFVARARNMLALRASQKAMIDRAAWLADEVGKATQAMMERERDTIFRLSRAAEYRDPETGAHILRMAHVSRLVGEQLGWSGPQLDLLLEAAPMHDIGKVGIPDSILLKPGRLDADEITIMRRHAAIGHGILAGSSSELLQLAAQIALSHHEKYDGSGYPHGLAGEAIPLCGRIVAVADVFDALTSVRPYKPAWEIDKARSYMAEQRGLHFDPVCLDAFFRCWDAVLAVRQRFQDPDHPH